MVPKDQWNSPSSVNPYHPAQEGSTQEAQDEPSNETAAEQLDLTSRDPQLQAQPRRARTPPRRARLLPSVVSVQ